MVVSGGGGIVVGSGVGLVGWGRCRAVLGVEGLVAETVRSGAADGCV